VNRSNFEAVALRVAFVSLISFLAARVQPFAMPVAVLALLGIVVAVAALLLASRLQHAAPQNLVAGFLGSVAGLCLGLLVTYVCSQAGIAPGAAGQFLRIALPLVGGYIGLVTGLANAAALPFDLVTLEKTAASNSTTKILDTSVLIDGRIVDIAESGFMEGRLIVPRFVLHELQLVADSSDSAKRNRGRRGLDVVQLLQKQPRIRLEVSGEDFPETREVDLKLIELAKRLQAKIVTNDFNLNKLAQVQGLTVLNINELANSLKPVVLPGEVMRVFILKEGKEHNQGVAYLDDGTMVVVDNARRMISKTVDVIVTSVLQTTAGKMIFGRFDERQQSVGEPRASVAAGTAAP
jgi:uncharacterized protein YacL